MAVYGFFALSKALHGVIGVDLELMTTDGQSREPHENDHLNDRLLGASPTGYWFFFGTACQL